MARLSLRLLGTLQATVDDCALAGFRSDKERGLLAYLAEESQQPHRRAKLAGLLWPELTESAARNNLRRALSNLRRTIGDRNYPAAPLLLVTSQTIQFDAAGDASVDVLTFRTLLDPSKQPTVEQLEAAIELYRGDFLDGLSLHDCSAFEDWMVLCRERYQRLLLETLHRLVESYQDTGDLERALVHAWRQVEIEPWWEDAHRQLMRLLAVSGRRSEALAQYARCRSLLTEELEVEPSEDTVRLYEQIRDEILAESLAAPRRRARPSHNLPVALGPFVGREAEIAEIQSRLQDPDCRLLTLVGPGGIGKTRLALEAVGCWLSQAARDGLRGVYLVSLAPLRSPEDVVPAIAQAIGFQFAPGREPEQQLLSYLSRKHMLLILDSFEHLVDAADLVAEMLTNAPYLKIVVTSRARLNLHGEYCFPVVGIDFPEQMPEEANEALAFAAVRLFLLAARQVRPACEPTDADLSEISRICHLVQGMPLGILLAAAWMEVLGPAGIAAEIGKGLDFLEADWLDVPERQRSLRAVFDRSWGLLSERERLLFQALSTFSGGFTRAAAEQVTGASLHELKTLTDKSLLRYTPSGRYEIHELLRQYAAEKLDALPGIKTEIRHGHCAYYIAALERWEADLFGSRQQEALREMEADIDNLRAAWDWAVEQGQAERLDRAMEALENFYWHRGRYREAVTAFQAAAAVTKKAADRVTALRVSSRALAWQSNFQRALGQKDAASLLQEQCLKILDLPALAGSDTRLERAFLSWSIGATICMADYAQGRERFEESYSLFRALDHRWGMAWTLQSQGTMSMFLGEYHGAKQRFEEALASYRTLGYQAGLASSLSRLAQIAWLQGRFEEAARLAREAVATSLEAGSRTELAYARMSLGETLEKVGKFPEAHSAFQQSLELYNDLGHRDYVTEAHVMLGSVEIHMGRYVEARDHVQTGLALARQHGPPYCIGWNLILLGCLALGEGAYVMAQRFLQDGIAAYREVGGHQDDLSWGLAMLALAAHGLKDSCGARRHLCQALELAAECGAALPLLCAIPAMALLLAAAGENERAVELYALASRYPFVANSRWFASVAGDTLAEVATTLPAERVAILKERGRARDLEATSAELFAELSR
jgi:predicted ATPase/DNA-binding SARP family transcriptional activator